MTTVAIHWFRRDLRLQDNTALTHATQEAEQVVGLFILDPKLLDAPKVCQPRVAFMYGCLVELSEKLAKRGGRLIIRRGKPVGELRKAVQELGASHIYFNRDYTTYARKRDSQVETALSDIAQVHTFKDLVVFEKDELLTGSGKNPYTVYTPYKRKWLGEVGANLPARYSVNWDSLNLTEPTLMNADSLPVPPVPAGFEKTSLWAGGEETGYTRLKKWAGALSGSKSSNSSDSATTTNKANYTARDTPSIESYAEERNLPGIDGTSQLSPYLRFGAISPRQCYRAALNARERAATTSGQDSCDSWIGELIWRDFYYQILWNFPQVARTAFQERYASVSWENNQSHFEAWCAGQTGYPIVDAGMRQLNNIHWMHNRLRMITASFLTKDLLLNWQLGERYFWEHLIDGDQPSNNGGWQWSASTGTDAQPYFRVFNPTTQGEKFDPDGRFIRQWIPELAKVPDKYIHAPHTLPTALQEELGVVIGRDYPAPIVDHQEARERAIRAYKI